MKPLHDTSPNTNFACDRAHRKIVGRDRNDCSSGGLPLPPYVKMPTAELNALILRAQAGDIAARNRVVMQVLRLAGKLASHWCRAYGRLDLCAEMVQVAVVGYRIGETDEPGGILRAIALFNPRKGTKFTTYCSYWITASIAPAMQQACGRPGGQYLTYRIRKVIDKMRERQDPGAPDPTPEEVAAYFEQTGRKAPARKRILQALLPATCEVEATDDLHDSAAPVDDTQAVAAIAEQRRDTAVRRAVAHLPERERKVIRARFGFGRDDEMTLNEVGRKLLGTTRERVRQIETKAKDRLKIRLAHELQEK